MTAAATMSQQQAAFAISTPRGVLARKFSWLIVGFMWWLAATRCCALPCTPQKPLQEVLGARGLRAPGLRAQAGSGRGPGPLRWAWAEGGGAVARLELTKKGLSAT